MSVIEKELLERIERLDEQKQRRVLEYVRSLEESASTRRLTAREILLLPDDERRRIVAAQVLASQQEDFELFEAYAEEELDDPE